MIRDLPISSMSWPALLERCSECLTARETKLLTVGRGRLAVAGTTIPFRSGETVSQALLDDGSTSFDHSSVPDSAAPLRVVSEPEVQAARDHFAPDVSKFVPWPIPESVFLLYENVEGKEGTRRREPSATAFVLSVPDRNHHTITRFLVTARHVVDPTWAHCSIQNPSSIQVRLNRRSGGVGYENIVLEVRHRRHFFTPSDSTADLAVIPLDKELIPNLESYKFFDTPFRLLPSQSELREIASSQPNGASDMPRRQLVTASLRSQIPASVGEFPLFDSGILSDITNQPVNIQCGSSGSSPIPRPLHVWMIDASLPDGVSGAPVYASIVRGGQVSRTAVLLGIQSITWPDRGVAGITPATVLGRSYPECACEAS